MEAWIHNFLIWWPVPKRARRRVRAAAMRLAPGQLIVREMPPGQICCLEGILWITQAGHPEDILLRAGERFCPASTGKVVVEAFAPALARLTPRTRSEGFLQ